MDAAAAGPAAAGVVAAGGATVPVALKRDQPLQGMTPGGSGAVGGAGGCGTPSLKPLQGNTPGGSGGSGAMGGAGPTSDAVSPAFQPLHATTPGGSGATGGAGATSDAVSPVFQPLQAYTPGGSGAAEAKMEPDGPMASVAAGVDTVGVVAPVVTAAEMVAAVGADATDEVTAGAGPYDGADTGADLGPDARSTGLPVPSMSLAASMLLIELVGAAAPAHGGVVRKSASLGSRRSEGRCVGWCWRAGWGEAADRTVGGCSALHESAAGRRQRLRACVGAHMRQHRGESVQRAVWAG